MVNLCITLNYFSSVYSIYGARHLASKLETTSYEFNRVEGSELDRMDTFVLLDLLGAKDPTIISSQVDTDVSLTCTICFTFLH